MTRRRHAAWALAVVVAIPAACGSGHSSKASPVVVTATGRIGPLHVDESDRADVTSFAGKPEAERRGRYSINAPFDALGYGCRGRAATTADGVPGCKTVFYLDSRSGKLALVYTDDARFEIHGVHVGTATAVAERRLHSRAFGGCYDGLRFDTKTGFLVVWLEGAKDAVSREQLHPVGGRVAFLVVHSRRRNPGVLDCIDS